MALASLRRGNQHSDAHPGKLSCARNWGHSLGAAAAGSSCSPGQQGPWIMPAWKEGAAGAWFGLSFQCQGLAICLVFILLADFQSQC